MKMTNYEPARPFSSASIKSTEDKATRHAEDTLLLLKWYCKLDFGISPMKDT